MSSRPLEILNRLETIDLEAATLRKELRKALETEKKESVQKADLSMFKDTTSRLLAEFLDAPNNMLSFDDIRLYVIFDEDASESAIRSLIKRARKEMKDCPCCHCEIKTIPKKGYKLAR